MNILYKIYYSIFPECRSVSDCNLRQHCNCGKCEDVAISKEKLVLTSEGIKECSYDLCDISKPVDSLEVGKWVTDGDRRYFKNAYNPLPPTHFGRTDHILIKEAKDLYPLLSKQV